jgi:protein-S-isoprenylcysteine O-methyltransferase Ste14
MCYLQYPALWSLSHQTWWRRSRFRTPPNRLTSTGPYGYSRNPIYLGHLIYLLGLSLTLRSWFGAVITIAVALWFRRRVIGDEKNLATRLGKPYLEYMKKVPRWI